MPWAVVERVLPNGSDRLLRAKNDLQRSCGQLPMVAQFVSLKAPHRFCDNDVRPEECNCSPGFILSFRIDISHYKTRDCLRLRDKRRQ